MSGLKNHLYDKDIQFYVDDVEIPSGRKSLSKIFCSVTKDGKDYTEEYANLWDVRINKGLITLYAHPNESISTVVQEQEQKANFYGSRSDSLNAFRTGRLFKFKKNNDYKIKYWNEKDMDQEQLVGVQDEMENNQHGVRFIRAETIKDEGLGVDFDRYSIEDRSQLSTKEINVVVDFKDELISGDIVAYGDWYDLDEEDAVKYLGIVTKEDMVRDFTNIRKKYDQRLMQQQTKKNMEQDLER